MMKRLLLLAAVLLALPAANAQNANFTFESVFPVDTLDTDGNGMHGIAVDKAGKVFMQPFGGTFTYRFPGADTDSVELVINATTSRAAKEVTIREIFVFNADGSAADTLTFLNGAVPDTLGLFRVGTAANGRPLYDTRSGRGLRYCEAEDAVYVSQFDTIYKINATTLEAEAKVIPYPGSSLTQVGVDDACNVTTAPVVAAADRPIRIYDANLGSTPLATVAPNSSTFSRGIITSPDGNTVFETAYENTFTIVHQRPTEFDDFAIVDSTFFGMRTESGAFQPGIDRLWVSAGNPLNVPNDSSFAYRWSQNTWYAFNVSDVLNSDGTVNREPLPVDSLTINNPEAGRPRGITFTSDGATAYVAQFSNAGSVQKFVAMGVSIEDAPGEAEDFALGQNHPNPFTGETVIPFSVKDAGHVALRVYDVTGREVALLADEEYPAGNYTASFAADGLAAGTYLYVLDVDGERMSRRMLVVR